MRLAPILALLLCISFTNALAQDFIWAKRTGVFSDDYVSDIQASADGSMIMTGGYFNGSTFLDTILLPGPTHGQSNVFVGKVNKEGAALWATAIEMNTSTYCYVRGMAIDSATGEVVITGGYTTSFTLGGVSFPAYGGFSNTNGFVIKLDSNGGMVWGKSFLGLDNVFGHDVAIDASGNVYCTGSFKEKCILGNDTMQVAGTNGTSHYLYKFSSNGTLQWYLSAASGDANHLVNASQGKKLSAIEVLSGGDIILAGNYRDSLSIGGSVVQLIGNSFGDDIFITRLTPSGIVVWLERAGGSGNETVRDLAIDDQDRIHMVGEIGNQSTFGSFLLGASATFFHRLYYVAYNSSGTVITAKSSLVSENEPSEATGVTCDKVGNVYVTGQFSNTLTLDNQTVTGSGGKKMFTAKFSSNSNAWEWSQNTNNFSVWGITTGISVAARAEDDLYVGGNFEQSISIGPQTLSTQGSDDLFYTRLVNCSAFDASVSFVGNSSLCGSQSVTLTTDTNSSFSYQWIANGAQISGATTPSFTTFFSGNYAVIADSAGCLDTSNVAVVSTGIAGSIALASFNPICESDSALMLTGGTPTGGTYSGTGVSGGVFDPSVTGAGTYPITYTFNDTVGGCVSSVTNNIQVLAAPVVVMLPLDTACSDQTSVLLSAGIPSGGTYSGTGVSSGTFDASVAGIGTHTIYYTRTNNNCTATDSAAIVVVTSPTILFALQDAACNSDSPIAMNANPTGGIYSGTGVSGNFFIPQVVNPGNYAVAYSVSANGCTSSVSDTIAIDTAPIASLGALPSLCETAPAIDLSSFAAANTDSSYLLGSGISGSIFNPVVAGSGTHTILFIATNSCGNDTASQAIIVHPNPIVTLSSFSGLCINASTIALSGGTPSGGVYSGVGVNAGVFDPSVAGIGSHTITYAYTNGNGCSDSASTTLEVNALPVVTLDTLGGICVNRPSFNLANGLPLGGNYFGTGVSSGAFLASTAGVGDHTLNYSYTDGNGCVNTQQILVDIRAVFNDTVQHVACDSFTDELNTTYYSSGTYIDSLISLGNCDSIIVREVMIHPSFIDSVTVETCYEFTSATNNTYTASGIYLDTLTTVHGCDSIIQTDLIINDTAYGSIDPIACDSYVSPGGSLLTTTGIYVDTLTSAAGCDSILTINLTINPSALDTLAVSACDMYVSPGSQNLTASGIYFDSLFTTQGCDSIVRIELTISPSYSDTNYSSTCVSYTSAGGVTYSISGVFTETYASVASCDSIVVEDVTILPLSQTSISPVACQSYVSPNGSTYTSSGNYVDTITASNGCDSIIAINLTVNPIYSDTLYETGCDSFFIAIANQWVFTSGTTITNLTSVLGCDSVINTSVTLVPSIEITVTELACDSFTSALGTVYYSSSTFTEVLTRVNGCDSTVNVNLTVHSSTSDTLSIVACDSFTSTVGTYTASGFYLENFTSQHGCDSLVTLNLTINSSAAITVPAVSCDSFISPSGAIYVQSGFFSETLVTSANCDSVVTYDVTIHNTVAQTIAVASCDSFTSPSGTVYLASGAFPEILSTSNGCDSIVTYDVMLSPTLFTTVAESACVAFTSPLGEVYTQSGTFMDTTSSANGCDSVLTYVLTIHQPDSNSMTVTSCGPYQSSWGSVYTISGLYIDSSLTSTGCDSVSYLNLTVIDVDTSVTLNGSTLTANENSTQAAFQWFECTEVFTPIAGETNASFTATASGNYAVEVTLEACVDTSRCQFLQAVGVNKWSAKDLIRIYPNPSHGEVNVDFGSEANAIGIEVRNMLGQVVFQEAYSRTSSATIRINQAAGLYTVLVSIDGSESTHRMVIE